MEEFNVQSYTEVFPLWDFMNWQQTSDKNWVRSPTKKIPDDWKSENYWKFILRNDNPAFWGENRWDILNKNPFLSNRIPYKNKKNTPPTIFYYDIVLPHQDYDISKNQIAGLVEPKAEWINQVKTSLLKVSKHLNVKFIFLPNLKEPTKDKKGHYVRFIFTHTGWKKKNKKTLGFCTCRQQKYSGDIVLRVKSENQEPDWGGEDTVLHEISHRLGLSHIHYEQHEKEFLKKNNITFTASPFNNPLASIMNHLNKDRTDLGPFDILALEKKYGLNPNQFKKKKIYALSHNNKGQAFLSTSSINGTIKDPFDTLLYQWGALIGHDAVAIDLSASKLRKTYLSAIPMSHNGLLKLESDILDQTFQNYAWFNFSRRVKILVSGKTGAIMKGFHNTTFICKDGKGDIFLGKGHNKVGLLGKNFDARIYLRNRLRKVSFYFPDLDNKDLSYDRRQNDLYILEDKSNSTLIIFDYYKISYDKRLANFRFYVKQDTSYIPSNYSFKNLVSNGRSTHNQYFTYNYDKTKVQLSSFYEKLIFKHHTELKIGTYLNSNMHLYLSVKKAKTETPEEVQIINFNNKLYQFGIWTDKNFHAGFNPKEGSFFIQKGMRSLVFDRPDKVKHIYFKNYKRGQFNFKLTPGGTLIATDKKGVFAEIENFKKSNYTLYDDKNQQIQFLTSSISM